MDVHCHVQLMQWWGLSPRLCASQASTLQTKPLPSPLPLVPAVLFIRVLISSSYFSDHWEDVHSARLSVRTLNSVGPHAGMNPALPVSKQAHYQLNGISSPRVGFQSAPLKVYQKHSWPKWRIHDILNCKAPSQRHYCMLLLRWATAQLRKRASFWLEHQ